LTFLNGASSLRSCGRPSRSTEGPAKLIEAIETAGDIAVLTERLRGLESEVKHIEEAIA